MNYKVHSFIPFGEKATEIKMVNWDTRKVIHPTLTEIQVVAKQEFPGVSADMLVIAVTSNHGVTYVSLRKKYAFMP